MSLDKLTSQPLPIHARRHGDVVQVRGNGREINLPVAHLGGGRLALRPASEGVPTHNETLAACEALSNHATEEVLVVLDRVLWCAREAQLLKSGCAQVLDGDTLGVFPELLWQLHDLWLPEPHTVFPQVMMPGPHGAHPLRPAKPIGTLYHRYIPWLDQVFSLRALECEADLPLFHRWMNDTRIAAFFDEAGTMAEHQGYLARMADDPHMMPVFGCLDGVPLFYFELYWARENRIGAHYEAGVWDRGWHVLVGEEHARGADYITAWLPSLMHYMFLAEPRTQALVGEPAASHHQQIRNLTRSGFARVKDFDFAHKRATLVRLERDYFFKSRLWARPDPEDPGRPLRLSCSALLTRGNTK